MDMHFQLTHGNLGGQGRDDLSKQQAKTVKKKKKDSKRGVRRMCASGGWNWGDIDGEGVE